MATLRRILKYTPAVVLVLLVVAWVVSLLGQVRCSVTLDKQECHTYSFELHWGRLHLDWQRTCLNEFMFAWWPVRPEEPRSTDWLGFFEYNKHFWVILPLPALITAMLPIGVGPLVTFRFRLWHYLAYTALIALELTYYKSVWIP